MNPQAISIDQAFFKPFEPLKFFWTHGQICFTLDQFLDTLDQNLTSGSKAL